jgi:hypothetical protein
MQVNLRYAIVEEEVVSQERREMESVIWFCVGLQSLGL